MSVKIYGVEQNHVASLAADCRPVRSDGREGGKEWEKTVDLSFDVREDRWPPELRNRANGQVGRDQAKEWGKEREKEGGGERNLSRRKSNRASSTKTELVDSISLPSLGELRQTHLDMPVERKRSDRKANKEG